MVSVVRTPRGEKLKVLCDNNVWYLFPELAKAIKVSPEALRARFARMHWSHPDFLSENRFKAYRPAPLSAKKRPQRRATVAVGFAALGDRPRSGKLASLASPSRLERSLCSA